MKSDCLQRHTTENYQATLHNFVLIHSYHSWTVFIKDVTNSKTNSWLGLFFSNIQGWLVYL